MVRLSPVDNYTRQPEKYSLISAYAWLKGSQAATKEEGVQVTGRQPAAPTDSQVSWTVQ